MEIKITTINNGIQHINRLTFKGVEGKPVHIDLWDDELKELKEQINQMFIEEI